MSDRRPDQVTGVNSSVVIGAVVSIILFAVSAVVYTTVAGYDPDRIIGLLTAIAAPTVLGLMTLLRTDVIKRQTNGALSRIDERLANVENNTDTDTSPVPVQYRTREVNGGEPSV